MNTKRGCLLAGTALFSLLLGPSALARAQSHDSATEARLLAGIGTAAQLLGAGATQVGTVHTTTLHQGQSRTFPATFAASKCYVVLATADDSIANIDVSIERGHTPLARDTDSAPNALVRYCTSTHGLPVTLRLAAYRGAGNAALALYTVPEQSAAAQNTTVATSSASAGALERLASVRDGLAGDYAQVSPPLRQTGDQGQRASMPIVLTPGRCYRIIAAGEESIANLDLALLAPNQTEMARDSTQDATPTLGVLQPLCPATPGTYNILGTIARGHGTYAVQVFGSGAQATASAAPTARFAIGGTGSDFVAIHLRQLAERAFPNATAEGDVLAGTLRTNEARDVSFSVQAGRCYIVVAAGVPSIRELNVQVLDAFGNEMAHDATQDAFPSARACPQVGGVWHATVRAFAGYGPFGAQVLSEPH